MTHDQKLDKSHPAASAKPDGTARTDTAEDRTRFTGDGAKPRPGTGWAPKRGSQTDPAYADSDPTLAADAGEWQQAKSQLVTQLQTPQVGPKVSVTNSVLAGIAKLLNPEIRLPPQLKPNEGVTATRWPGAVDFGLPTPRPDPEDTKQGYIGDCYLIAMLRALARFRPEVIDQMVKSIGHGRYLVTFQGLPPSLASFAVHFPAPVIVDDRLWTDPQAGEPIYANAAAGNDRSIMLIEKAFASLQGGYAGLDPTPVDPNPDKAKRRPNPWTSGSFDPSDLAAQRLTGHKPNWEALGSDEAVTSRLSMLWARERRAAVNFSSKVAVADPEVVANHAYTLTDYAQGKVSLENPWGGANKQHPHLVDKPVSFLLANFDYMRVIAE